MGVRRERLGETTVATQYMDGDAFVSIADLVSWLVSMGWGASLLQPVCDLRDRVRKRAEQERAAASE